MIFVEIFLIIQNPLMSKKLMSTDNRMKKKLADLDQEIFKNIQEFLDLLDYSPKNEANNKRLVQIFIEGLPDQTLDLLKERQKLFPLDFSLCLPFRKNFNRTYQKLAEKMFKDSPERYYSVDDVLRTLRINMDQNNPKISKKINILSYRFESFQSPEKLFHGIFCLIIRERLQLTLNISLIEPSEQSKEFIDLYEKFQILYGVEFEKFQESFESLELLESLESLELEELLKLLKDFEKDFSKRNPIYGT